MSALSKEKSDQNISEHFNFLTNLYALHAHEREQRVKKSEYLLTYEVHKNYITYKYKNLTIFVVCNYYTF